jgi:predicted transcriptional regulator
MHQLCMTEILYFEGKNVSFSVKNIINQLYRNNPHREIDGQLLSNTVRLLIANLIKNNRVEPVRNSRKLRYKFIRE